MSQFQNNLPSGQVPRPWTTGISALSSESIHPASELSRPNRHSQQTCHGLRHISRSWHRQARPGPAVCPSARCSTTPRNIGTWTWAGRCSPPDCPLTAPGQPLGPIMPGQRKLDKRAMTFKCRLFADKPAAHGHTPRNFADRRERRSADIGTATVRARQLILRIILTVLAVLCV